MLVRRRMSEGCLVAVGRGFCCRGVEKRCACTRRPYKREGRMDIAFILEYNAEFARSPTQTASWIEWLVPGLRSRASTVNASHHRPVGVTAFSSMLFATSELPRRGYLLVLSGISGGCQPSKVWGLQDQANIVSRWRRRRNGVIIPSSFPPFPHAPSSLAITKIDVTEARCVRVYERPSEQPLHLHSLAVSPQGSELGTGRDKDGA